MFIYPALEQTDPRLYVLHPDTVSHTQAGLCDSVTEQACPVSPQGASAGHSFTCSSGSIPVCNVVSVQLLVLVITRCFGSLIKISKIKMKVLIRSMSFKSYCNREQCLGGFGEAHFESSECVPSFGRLLDLSQSLYPVMKEKKRRNRCEMLKPYGQRLGLKGQI